MCIYVEICKIILKLSSKTQVIYSSGLTLTFCSAILCPSLQRYVHSYLRLNRHCQSFDSLDSLWSFDSLWVSSFFGDLDSDFGDLDLLRDLLLLWDLLSDLLLLRDLLSDLLRDLDLLRLRLCLSRDLERDLDLDLQKNEQDLVISDTVRFKRIIKKQLEATQ